MSQTDIPSTAHRSSIRELKRHRTREEVRQHRTSKERLLQEIHQDVAEIEERVRKLKQDLEDDQEEEERLEEAMDVMSETDPIELDIGTGGLAKVTDDIIVERTEDGFNTYVVVG